MGGDVVFPHIFNIHEQREGGEYFFPRFRSVSY